MKRFNAAMGIVAVLTAHCLAASLTVPSEHKSLAEALTKAKSGDTVWVENGTYKESVTLNPGVVLKARALFGASLAGKGRGTIVTMGHGSVISGFDIRGGTVGISSKSAGARILNCRVTNNTQTGIMCVGHLPEIADNIIAFNNGSGIQGWDLRSTAATINHNTIAYNDNHGIALGGNSDVIIENSIIAYNGQYGVKADAQSVRARVTSSNLYRNGADTAPLSNDCISLDPSFTDAHKLDFSLQAGSGCIRAATQSEDMGSRQLK